MKKIICKVEYDTAASEIVKRFPSVISAIPRAMRKLFIRPRTASSSSMSMGVLSPFTQLKTSRECPQPRLRNGSPTTNLTKDF